ncbi:hypothetical protein RHSIM_Rhsim09G0020600 [Rhododendron simsii]|uniref:Uncharacterized protein n=1 Tax=Rhododendron simsii TaxID=118357 RepID=A0A834LEK5_RHOSS|nr:hypothetical protein RHSIM_Rhsim09G0020600 [Rhododendron simsii]
MIGMETVSDCRTATGDTIGKTTKHLASLSLDQFVQMDESEKIEEECDTEILLDDQGCETHGEAEDKKEDTMPTAPNIGMETVCDCRTATGDTIGNTTKHLASLSLDQFVQTDDMKEDTMPADPDVKFFHSYFYFFDPFKTIIFYPPGVELPPPDFVEEVRRPSPREMVFQYAFWQKKKKEREDRILATMGRPCRTCTNGRAFGSSPPWMVLMDVLPVNPMPPRLAPGTE